MGGDTGSGTGDVSAPVRKAYATQDMRKEAWPMHRIPSPQRKPRYRPTLTAAAHMYLVMFPWNHSRAVTVLSAQRKSSRLVTQILELGTDKVANAQPRLVNV